MATAGNLVAGNDVLAVSVPGGGVARQFRIQYHTETDPRWRMYASFLRGEDAESCLWNLQQSGCQARLVCYGISPSAA